MASKLIVEIGPADFPLRTRLGSRMSTPPTVTGLSKLRNNESYLGIGNVADHFSQVGNNAGNRIKFVVGNGKNLPLKKESADEVHASFVEGFAQGLFPNEASKLIRRTNPVSRIRAESERYWKYVDLGVALLSEARRVLKKKGKLVIGTSCTPDELRDLSKYVQSHGFKLAGHGFMFSPPHGALREIKAELSREQRESRRHVGLTPRQITSLARHRYLSRARKIVLERE